MKVHLGENTQVEINLENEDFALASSMIYLLLLWHFKQLFLSIERPGFENENDSCFSQQRMILTTG